MPETDDVHIDNTKTYSGMDWKGLAVIAATALGAGGLYTFAPKTPAPQSPAPYIVPQTVPMQPPAIQPAPVQPPSQESKFGVEVEVRDAITHQPIKIDWNNVPSSVPIRSAPLPSPAPPTKTPSSAPSATLPPEITSLYSLPGK